MRQRPTDGDVSSWSPAYRVLQLVVLGQIVMCITLAILGAVGGIQYQPGANNVSNIGAALIFSAILYAALALGLCWTIWAVSREAVMAKAGLLIAEIVFGLLSAVFFAPVAVVFVAVAAVATVMLPLSRRREA